MTTDPKDAEIARLSASRIDIAREADRLQARTEKAEAKVITLTEQVDAIAAHRDEVMAERDAALAQVARLQHLIREASDPDFLWGAMDNVNDMDADITEFANAASRAIRASIPEPDTISRRDAQMRAEGWNAAANWLEKRLNNYVAEHGSCDPSTNVTEFPGNGDEWVCEQEETIDAFRVLAAAGKEAGNG